MSIELFLDSMINELEKLKENQKIYYLNLIKERLHDISPFRNEPVDCVIWVKNDKIIANDYNPNKVAPPEMELLKVSIDSDGYTQPIVSFNENDSFVVVDGYHRNRVGRENEKIRKRIKGYLPISVVNQKRSDRCNRIASTIRHNRARGKHAIDAMSNIVIELKKRNWSNERICKNLGMDEDEVLRLCQITGLRNLFSDKDFSFAWEIDENDEIERIDYE